MQYKLSDHKFEVQACKGKPRRNTKWTTLLEFGGDASYCPETLRAKIRQYFNNKTGAGSIQTLVDGDWKSRHTVRRLEDPVNGVDSLRTRVSFIT